MEYRTADALCGVYKITNDINGKVYIGQSINVKARWKDHEHSLNRKDSRCTLLQRAWNKYGEENFSFEILELCPEDMLDSVEIKYINLYDSHNNGYNIEPGGNKNKHLSEETKKKIGDANRGKKRTDEERRKMSEARAGEKNAMFGRRHTKAAKNKMSKAKKGKPGHPRSAETRKAISQANKGKLISDETRKKLSESHKGKIPSNKILKPVYCVELNKIFDTPSDAAKELSINSGNIMSCCKGDRKTCGGYHWEYADKINKI